MCETALEVKQLLLEEGINATVVDPVFLKPLILIFLNPAFQTPNG